MTTMQNEPPVPDPRVELMERVATLAGQIFCARAGEPIGRRYYGATDAMHDASLLLTVALNAGEVERYLSKAADALELPTIWPTASPDDEPAASDEGPF